MPHDKDHPLHLGSEFPLAIGPRRRQTGTHTYAEMEISSAAYYEIAEKLKDADDGREVKHYATMADLAADNPDLPEDTPVTIEVGREARECICLIPGQQMACPRHGIPAGSGETNPEVMAAVAAEYRSHSKLASAVDGWPTEGDAALERFKPGTRYRFVEPEHGQTTNDVESIKVDAALKRFRGEAADEVLTAEDISLLERRCFYPGFTGDAREWHDANLRDKELSMADIVARQNARQADAHPGDGYVITEVGSTPWAMAMMEAGHAIRHQAWDGERKKTLWYCDSYNQAWQWWNPDYGYGHVSDSDLFWIKSVKAGWEIATIPDTFQEAINFGPPDIHIYANPDGSRGILLRRGDFNNNPLNQQFEFDRDIARLVYPKIDPSKIVEEEAKLERESSESQIRKFLRAFDAPSPTPKAETIYAVRSADDHIIIDLGGRNTRYRLSGNTLTPVQ